MSDWTAKFQNDFVFYEVLPIVYLSVCVSTYLPTQPPTYLSIYLSISHPPFFSQSFLDWPEGGPGTHGAERKDKGVGVTLEVRLHLRCWFHLSPGLYGLVILYVCMSYQMMKLLIKWQDQPWRRHCGPKSKVPMVAGYTVTNNFVMMKLLVT